MDGAVHLRRAGQALVKRARIVKIRLPGSRIVMARYAFLRWSAQPSRLVRLGEVALELRDLVLEADRAQKRWERESSGQSSAKLAVWLSYAASTRSFTGTLGMQRSITALGTLHVGPVALGLYWYWLARRERRSPWAKRCPRGARATSCGRDER